MQSITKKIEIFLAKYDINLYNYLQEIVPITDIINRYNLIIMYNKSIPDDLVLTINMLNNYFPFIHNGKNTYSNITHLDFIKSNFGDEVLPAVKIFMYGHKYKYIYNIEPTNKTDLLYICLPDLGNLISFLETLPTLKKSCDIYIKIEQISNINMKDLQVALDRWHFSAVEFINIMYPTMFQLYRNPIYIIITGYMTNLDNGIGIIGPSISEIKNYTLENMTKIYEDLLQITKGKKNDIIYKDQLLSFILSGITTFYYKYYNFRINKIYVNKFKYTTWKKNLAIYLGKKLNILELGVYEGVSSLFFLDNMMDHPESSLQLVDTWAGSIEYGRDIDWDQLFSRFKLNIYNAPNSDKVSINRKTTIEMLNKYINRNEFFDIIFIDANHDSRAVIHDAILAWRCLNIGGTLIFDDYTWNKMPYEWQRPKIAIDAFLSMFQENIEIIYIKSQVMIRKISNYEEIG